MNATVETDFPEQLVDLGHDGFALAMRWLRHREDAADAVQDAIRSALRHRRSFDPQKGNCRAWFFKILKNRCIDMLRKNKRQASGDFDGEGLPSPMRSPAEVAQHNEMAEILLREIHAMDETQRELILLRDFHGLSYNEIAMALSIHVGTVMSRLHRARKQLKQRMEPHR
ncbi:MAG: sigma-70 family RNA polymerase sigma factor [Pirellulaceae bacterium]